MTTKAPAPSAGEMHRAYSTLSIEKAGVTEDDDYFYLNGTASTPTPDRVNDIVVSTGAKFNLPLPLLWQHDSSQPIGQVIAAKPNKNGIPITAQIPKVKEPGTLKDRIDEAVQSIQYKLVTGLSIGFRALRWEYIEDSNGIQFNEWDFMELSAVTIPANVEATIQSIKTLDRKQIAAAGKKSVIETVRLSLPRQIGPDQKTGIVRLSKTK